MPLQQSELPPHAAPSVRQEPPLPVNTLEVRPPSPAASREVLAPSGGASGAEEASAPPSVGGSVPASVPHAGERRRKAEDDAMRIRVRNGVDGLCMPVFIPVWRALAVPASETGRRFKNRRKEGLPKTTGAGGPVGRATAW